MQLFKKHQACMIYLYSDMMMLHLTSHYQFFSLFFGGGSRADLWNHCSTFYGLNTCNIFSLLFPFSLHLSSHISSERQNTVGRNIIIKIIKKELFLSWLCINLFKKWILTLNCNYSTLFHEGLVYIIIYETNLVVPRILHSENLQPVTPCHK